MRFFTLFLITILATYLGAYAQREGNIWYFGQQGSGLDFNTNPTKLLTNSRLVSSPNTFTEPITMSDRCGNLLFYSDGQTVWNNTHEVMENGSNLPVNTAGQVVLAVPHPKKEYLYFLFTIRVASTNPTLTDLLYSIIDMRLDDGKGAVTQKSIFLYNNNSLNVTAAKHINDKDFWVITTQGNTKKLITYLINENGINPSPNVSLLAANFGSGGKIRISPNNKKLAVSGVLGEASGNFIFDFDNSSGIVSNPLELPEPVGGSGYFDFSPDSEKIYWLFGSANAPLQVAQYQIKGKRTGQEILRTKYNISVSSNTNLFDMRVAPDGKLYVVNGRFLDVIENPNSIGSELKYRKEAYRVAPFAFLLPNNIANFILKKQKDIIATPVCENQTVNFKPVVNYAVQKWHWNFGDGTGISELETPSYKFSKTGVFQVVLVTIDSCGEWDTLHKNITIYPKPIVDFSTDSVSFCFDKAPVRLDVEAYPLSSYLWNTGDTAATMSVNKTGWYTVKISNPCASDQDSIYVHITPKTTATISDDTVFCEGNFKILDAQNEGAAYRWNTGATTRTIQIDRPGGYWVEIINECSSTVDSARVTFIREDVGGFIPNVFTPNGDGINDVFENHVLNTPNYSITICNRWGEKVFWTDNPLKNWDGTVNSNEASSGIYFYFITGTDCRGNNITFKGSISLLR